MVFFWESIRIAPEVVSYCQDASHYGFFGEFNPLSNFHPAVFTYNGTCNSHTEQFIQATKAEFCKDTETLNAILSALKCKELGRSVKNCNIHEWNKKAKELCLPGILCKFQQNAGLAAFLKIQGIKSCWSVVMITFGVMAYLFLAQTALLLTSTSIKAFKERCLKRYELSFILHCHTMWNQFQVEMTSQMCQPYMWKQHPLNMTEILQSSCLTMLCQTKRMGANYPINIIKFRGISKKDLIDFINN